MLSSTKTRRCLALALAAILGAAAALAFSMPTTGGADAVTTTTEVPPPPPPTYTLTVAGTESVTLNPQRVPVFVTGGGVQVTYGPTTSADPIHATAPGPNYFEVHLDLPVGARVTSVAISYSAVQPYGAAGTYIFGSYSPAFGSTRQYAIISPPYSPHTTAITTGNPITTIGGGRRYVIDWSWASSAYLTSVSFPTFYGATVKYTCTAPCVP